MTPALAPYHLLSWIWNCYFFVLTHWNNAALASLGATAVGAGVRDLSVVSVPLERLKFCRWSSNSGAKSSSPVRSMAGCSGAVRGCDAALARCISAVRGGRCCGGSRCCGGCRCCGDGQCCGSCELWFSCSSFGAAAVM